MKKFTFLFFLFSTMSGFVFAQSSLSEFDKAKEIKLLESTGEDVRRILAGYEHDADEDEDSEQYFSTEKARITIIFSEGDCSDDSAYWNVPKMTATKITIIPEETIESKDFDFSTFTKEMEDEESEYYTYHDEKAGIVFKVGDGEIQKIVLYPPKDKIGLLCSNESTMEIISGEKRMVDKMLQVKGCINLYANVTELNLSASEIVLGSDSQRKSRNHTGDKTKISVATTAIDPENDVLTYEYTVSVGEIIGTGANIVWDLSGVKPGTYTITAGVDDGCGICGQTVTKTVVVENAATVK